MAVMYATKPKNCFFLKCLTCICILIPFLNFSLHIKVKIIRVFLHDLSSKGCYSEKSWNKCSEKLKIYDRHCTKNVSKMWKFLVQWASWNWKLLSQHTYTYQLQRKLPWRSKEEILTATLILRLLKLLNTYSTVW